MAPGVGSNLMWGNGTTKSEEYAESTEAQMGALKELEFECGQLMSDNTNRQAVMSPRA